jgi:RNA polymerase sigma factor (sigma-70 family)
MAKSMVRNDEDCADAMQETVLKAFRAISGLKEAAYFNTWLFRILINECNMILRRRDRVVVMSDPPESIETSSSSAEIWICVRPSAGWKRYRVRLLSCIIIRD